MQSQPATALADNSLPRTDLRIVPTIRSRRLLGALRVATMVLVATGGYVHFCLYRRGYRTIPTIGIGFLLQVIGSALVVLALLIGPHAVARVAHVTDGLAGVLTRVATAGLAIGTLTAFALTRTPGGLFNFRERGLQPAPQALIALVAEIGVLVVVGAWMLARQARSSGTPRRCAPHVSPASSV
jgi:hypothetical protein